MTTEIIEGDCLEVLPTLADASVDAVICDPPYPQISRSYGRMTEAAWTAMMHRVVQQVRRILKPRGSAMFVLQPNSRKSGSMRAWLWEFMAWCCREWNMVQDIWWWNICTMPSGSSTQLGLTRPSLKACVWLGPPNCYRDQDAVLWSESFKNAQCRANSRFEGRYQGPSGHNLSVAIWDAAVKRGGVTPFNVLPIGNGNSSTSGGAHGHGAATPEPLCDWWVRYLVPPDGMVLDPFCGSGTVGVAVLKRGRDFIGIEQISEYCDIARRRLDQAEASKSRLAAA